MKTKMSLSAEMDLTQDSVVQLTCWCGQIALHELWGLGRTRLDRITRRKELLGSQSLAVVMQPDKNGMPQTEKARRMRAEAIPKGVPTEFRVPALRTPRTRREQQLKAENGGRPGSDHGLAADGAGLCAGVGVWSRPAEQAVCRDAPQL